MNKKRWIVKIFIISFFLAIIFGLGTNAFASKFNEIILILLTLLIIIVGIIFDMIGTSALTSKESTFHSMATKKIKGAAKTVELIKNSANVSSICNDVVGDVCGVISGSLGVSLSILISNRYNLSLSIMTVLIAAVISALTVGGKAIFKQVAIKNSDKIIYKVGFILSGFKKIEK